MLVGICFSGQVRTFARCWPSIYRHVFEPLTGSQVMVFAVTDKSGHLADLDVLRPFLGKLIVAQDPDMKGDARYNNPQQLQHLAQWTGGVNNFLLPLRRLQVVHDLYRTYAADMGLTADWLIHIRFDMEFFTSIEDLKAVPCDRIYIPKTDNHFGLNDRLAWGPPPMMEKYFNRLQHLDEYYGKGGLIHPETFLKCIMDNYRMPIGRSNCLCRIRRGDGTYSPISRNEARGDVVD